MVYELYYWPGIQGRGEYVRLALEQGGSKYVDIALKPENRGGGVPAIMKYLDGPRVPRPPFAPPFLKAGKQLIGQTANILLFLGGPLKLAPRDEAGKLWVHQLTDAQSRRWPMVGWQAGNVCGPVAGASDCRHSLRVSEGGG